METLIGITTEALKQLITEAVAEIMQKQSIASYRWLTPEQAMARLNIGKTSLYHLRITGAIRYSQMNRKTILYDSVSIDEYLSTHTKNTF